MKTVYRYIVSPYPAEKTKDLKFGWGDKIEEMQIEDAFYHKFKWDKVVRLDFPDNNTITFMSDNKDKIESVQIGLTQMFLIITEGFNPPPVLPKEKKSDLIIQ